MPYADKMIECEECNKDFIFTVDEQRRIAERGEEVVEPSLCPDCRTDELTEEGVKVRRTGVVKWFDERKGFGFVTAESGADVFVHYSGIEGSGFKTLEEGDEVEFEIEQTPKGPQAVHVMKTSEIPG